MATVESVYLSETAILRRLVLPTDGELGTAGARSLLAIGFSTTDRERILQLLQLNQEGSLSEAQRNELDNFLRVGGFLDLLHAHAHATLKRLEAS